MAWPGGNRSFKDASNATRQAIINAGATSTEDVFLHGLVFDGGGFVSQNGRELLEAPRFRQGFATVVVDLDRTAVNTITNATETRRWVMDRGFKSLIVVTSNYHMPRAMAELSHQLPDIVLIEFPVVSEQLKAGWAHGPTLRLLFTEYVKYVAAIARIHVPVIDQIFA